MSIEATGLSATVAWIAGYAVNSAWQVPVVLVIGLTAARLARPVGPASVYRVWIGALLAAVALPAVSTSGWDVWGVAAAGWAWLRGAESVGGGSVRVALAAGSADSAAGLHWAVWVVWSLVAVYAGSVLVGAARLVHGLVRVRELCRAAIELPATVLSDGELAGITALPRDLRIGEAEAVAGPMVVGMRPAWLLLPIGFMEQISADDARAAVAHELAHVRRGDFAKNLICRVLALPVTYHPCAWAMQARLAESREMACDALAAEQVGGSGPYARSLLRLAAALPGSLSGGQQTAGMAVGMLEGNRMERRILQMMQTRKELNSMAKAAVMAGLLLMTAGAGATVGGMHLRVQGDVEGARLVATSTGPVKWDRGPMLISSVDPEYPKVERDKTRASGSKAAHVVVLKATVGESGGVEGVSIDRSAGVDFDKQAMKAVRKYAFQPAVLHGKPVASQVRIEVNFQLF